MNLKLKKGIATAGVIMCMGGMAFTSQAASSVSVGVVSGDASGIGQAIVGSAAMTKYWLSYGARLIGRNQSVAKGYMIVKRTDGTKTHLKKEDGYINGKYAGTKEISVTKRAYKGDRKGIRITVKLSGTDKNDNPFKAKSGTMKY